MLRFSILPVMLLALLAVGCRSDKRAGVGGGAASSADRTALKGPPPARVRQRLDIQVKLPSAQQFEAARAKKAEGQTGVKENAARPAAAAQGKGFSCPRSVVETMLGVSLSDPHGCVVGSVNKGGPAEKAGIKPGDSIFFCDDQMVTCPSALAPYLQLADAPRGVKLTVLRWVRNEKAAGKATEGKARPGPAGGGQSRAASE